MELTEIEPAASNPVDRMHTSFLGIVKDFIDIIFNTGDLMDDDRTNRFGQAFKDAHYPGHLSRIPDKIREQIEDTGLKAKGASLKADQWKRIGQMMPVACCLAWRLGSRPGIGESGNTNVWLWWDVVSSLCTGMSLLYAHNISYDEAKRGVEELSKAAKGLLDLGIQLKPNWHMAMHYHE